MACARYSARAELRPAMEMRPSFVMNLQKGTHMANFARDSKLPLLPT